MRVDIRSAKANDLKHLIILFEQLWPDKLVSAQNITEIFTSGLISNSDEYIVAVVDDTVVGFCSFSIIQSFWQEGSMAYITELVVDTRHRGAGIGTALITRAEESSKERGCRMIELDSAFNRDLAHAFYEKNGFVKRAFVFSKSLMA